MGSTTIGGIGAPAASPLAPSQPIRVCLDPKSFWIFDTVALLFLFDKHCPIIE